MKESCLAEERTGKLKIEPYRFVLQVGEGGHVFDAFLDAAGKLHLDVLLAEHVVPVDERGRGKIKLGMFKSILVSDKCSLVDEFQDPLEIPCHFEQTPTLALFRFRVPEGTTTFQETPDRTMVHLKREQLLVPPSIYRMAFERVAD